MVKNIAHNKRITLAIKLVLVSALLTACVSGSPAPGTAADTGAITASGFLEAAEVNIVSEVGAKVAAIEAAEGESVSAGQTLIRLDDSLMLAQKAQAEAALAAAQANLAQIKAGPRPDAVAAAEAKLAAAQANLDGATRGVADAKALAANPPGLAAQITQAQTQVTLAQQAVEQAKADVNEAELWRNVSTEGTTERDVREHDLAAARASLAAAEAQLAGAQAYLTQLEQMRKFPADLIANLHAAQSRAETDEAEVVLAQAALDAAKAGATQEEIALAEALVRTAEANLAVIEAQLDRFALTSPIDGVMSKKTIEVGEVAQPGVPLLIVANTADLKLIVYVPETQIGRVAVNQLVNLSVDAYPGVTFEGSVINIGSKAEFTPSNVQTQEDRVKLVFAVKIRAPNEDGRLKAGMPADVVFREP